MPLAADLVLVALLAAGKPLGPGAPTAIPIQVDFDAPSGCSDADAFYAGLLSRSEQVRRAVAGEEGVRLGVRLTRVGTKVRGELRVGRESDTRSVEGASCDEVVEVLSLTAALALHEAPRPPAVAAPPLPRPVPLPTPRPAPALVAAPAPPPSPAPEPSPQPPALLPPPVVIVTPQPPPQPRSFRFELALSAVAAAVVTPYVNTGGMIAARLAHQAPDSLGYTVGLSLLYVPNDLLQSPDDVGVRWTAIGATVCPGLGRAGAIRLQPCAQTMGGWLSAEERSVTNPQSAHRSWWSLGATLRADAPLGAGFRLEAEVGLALPLVKRRFITTTPERTVGETPAVSPQLGFGIVRAL